MTKKQKKENALIEIRDIQNNINSMLLAALGFDVDSGYIVDQDNFSRIKINHGFLKYSPDGSDIPLHRKDVLFDPLNNRQLVNILFKVFLNKEEESGDLYVKVFYPVQDKSGTTAIQLRLENGILESQYYIDPSYGYIEIMIASLGVCSNMEICDSLKRLESLKNQLLTGVFE